LIRYRFLTFNIVDKYKVVEDYMVILKNYIKFLISKNVIKNKNWHIDKIENCDILQTIEEWKRDV